MNVETEAIVLKRFDFSESSQIGHFYCRDLGRVSALAKGIKRPNAALKGPLDLFQRARVRLTRRKGSDLWLVGRFEPSTGHRGLRANLDRLYASFYLTELYHAATAEESPDSALFDLLALGLDRLAAAGPRNVAPLVLTIELAFLARSGVGLEFDRCVRCNELPEGVQVDVVTDAGGVVCERCRDRGTPATRLSAGAWAFARRLDRTDPAKAKKLSGTQEQISELRRLVDRTVLRFVERPLHSTIFLRQVEAALTPLVESPRR